MRAPLFAAATLARPMIAVTGLLVLGVAAAAGCGATHTRPADARRRSAAARIAECQEHCSPMRVTDEVVWRRGCGAPCIESGAPADDPRTCGPPSDACTSRREHVFAFECPNWPSRPGPDAGGEPNVATTYTFGETPFPLLCVDDIDSGGVRCFDGLSTDGIEARCP